METSREVKQFCPPTYRKIDRKDKTVFQFYCNANHQFYCESCNTIIVSVKSAHVHKCEDGAKHLRTHWRSNAMVPFSATRTNYEYICLSCKGGGKIRRRKIGFSTVTSLFNHHMLHCGTFKNQNEKNRIMKNRAIQKTKKDESNTENEKARKNTKKDESNT